MVEHDEEWGTFWCKLANGFCVDVMTVCPLVGVETPHGDLIDEQKLFNGEHNIYSWEDVERAPVVISAEDSI